MVDLRNQETVAELEKQILLEIAERERKIRELQAEKNTFERMLLKARQQNALIKRVDVSRKNSVSRILIENSILESLKETSRVRKTRALYQDACLIVGTLKEGTFRTILHRMKNRGLISSISDGRWQIAAAGIAMSGRLTSENPPTSSLDRPSNNTSV